jgi:hypothetical protein
VSKRGRELEDVYRSEKTRGTKQPKTPESLELERLKREVIDLILTRRCTRNQFVSILRSYGLSEDSDLFRACLSGFDRWSRKVS